MLDGGGHPKAVPVVRLTGLHCQAEIVEARALLDVPRHAHRRNVASPQMPQLPDLLRRRREPLPVQARTAIVFTLLLLWLRLLRHGLHSGIFLLFC